MQAQFDPFVILNVDRSTPIRDIKKKYLKMVKQLHPDKYRNQGSQAFNEAQQQMTLITRAYQALTDPKERAKYDTTQISTFQDMRTNFQQFDRQNKPQPQSKIGVKGTFGKADLNDFNSNFEQQRRRDPNDRGYEDEMEMAPRMTIESAKQGYQAVNVEIDSPSMSALKGKNFDPNRFNELFEQNISSGSGRDLIEKPLDNPMGFSLLNSTSFSEVSVFDGKMIVGSEVDDFSSFDTGKGVAYTDYKKGFQTASIISQSGNFNDDGLTLQQRIQKREADSFDANFTKMNKSEWQRQAEYKFEQEQRKHLEQEREKQKKVVMKYHDQYQDYLPAPEPRLNTPSHNAQHSQTPQTSQITQHTQIPQHSQQYGSSYQPHFQQQYHSQTMNSQPNYYSQQHPTQQSQQQFPHQHSQQQFPHQHSQQHPTQQQYPQQNQFSMRIPQNSRQININEQSSSNRFIDDTQFLASQQHNNMQIPHPNMNSQIPGHLPSSPPQINDGQDRRAGRSYNDFMMDRMHNVFTPI